MLYPFFNEKHDKSIKSQNKSLGTIAANTLRIVMPVIYAKIFMTLNEMSWGWWSDHLIIDIDVFVYNNRHIAECIERFAYICWMAIGNQFEWLMSMWGCLGDLFVIVKVICVLVYLVYIWTYGWLFLEIYVWFVGRSSSNDTNSHSRNYLAKLWYGASDSNSVASTISVSSD